jgi:hypothetical protein
MRYGQIAHVKSGASRAGHKYRLALESGTQRTQEDVMLAYPAEFPETLARRVDGRR